VFTNDPDWLDREEYPFESKWFETDAGRMHYVDVGRGDTFVFVHGVPSWSFLFRKLIRGLSDRYRCVAMDHLGFGLSDKPQGYSYDPGDLQLNAERLLESLDLERVILVVHDWGGPLGLPYAIHRPQKVRGLVLFNTWMWPSTGDRRIELFGSILASKAYAALDTRYNVTMRMLPQALGTRVRMRSEIYRQYAEPLAEASRREGSTALLRAIVGATPWLSVLWQQAGALARFPALLCWGMRDIAFTERDLERWTSLFEQAEVHRYERVGHFPPEEVGDELCAVLDAFARSALVSRGAEPSA
jgi:haloalkane dehalogenase